MNKSDLAKLVEALPTHGISGYEWECGGCHYHWAEREIIVPFVESRIIPKDCEVCGKSIGADENVDRDGRPTEHERLVDLDAVLELLR